MRIIGGQFRRREIKAPKGDVTRPTTDRTREAAFNIISSRFDLAGARVVDLYSGSGALGLEAISRGADVAMFVDNSQRALKVSIANARGLGVERSCHFIRDDSVRWLKGQKFQSYDLILADPPYDSSDLTALADLALSALSVGGLFVLEHDRRFSPDEHPRLLLSRRYGKSAITVFESRD